MGSDLTPEELKMIMEHRLAQIYLTDGEVDTLRRMYGFMIKAQALQMLGEYLYQTTPAIYNTNFWN